MAFPNIPSSFCDLGTNTAGVPLHQPLVHSLRHKWLSTLFPALSLAPPALTHRRGSTASPTLRPGQLVTIPWALVVAYASDLNYLSQEGCKFSDCHETPRNCPKEKWLELSPKKFEILGGWRSPSPAEAPWPLDLCPVFASCARSGGAPCS